MFCKKDIFKNFAEFTGKFLCWSLSCFPMNFEKFSRRPVLWNICKRLLLQVFSYDEKLQTCQLSDKKTGNHSEDVAEMGGKPVT